MEGNFRKKIALKLKDSSLGSSTPSEVPEDNNTGTPAAPTTVAEDDSKQLSSSAAPLPPPLLPPPAPDSSNTDELKNLTQDLSWDQPLNLIGRAITAPLIHFCEVCDRPILIYGRMKKCRHAFCRECVKKAAGECPKCQTGDQVFEEASMGSVHICSHGGGRYDNKGCGRSYLSQRDLDAHIAYRHNKTTGTTPSAKMPPLQLPHGFFQHTVPPPPPGGSLSRPFPPPHMFPQQQPGNSAWTRPPPPPRYQ